MADNITVGIIVGLIVIALLGLCEILDSNDPDGWA